jgi:WD40 repeat protein
MKLMRVTIGVVNANSNLHDLSFPGDLAGFGSSAFSPDGMNIFYLPARTTVAVLSTSTRSEKFRLESHTNGIVLVEVSPDGKLLAMNSWDWTVKTCDLQDGRLLTMLKGTRGQNWSGGWSPDSTLIVVGSGEGLGCSFGKHGAHFWRRREHVPRLGSRCRLRAFQWMLDVK